MGDINLCNVVQVSHPSIRPTSGKLRLPVGLVILPSIPDWRTFSSTLFVTPWCVFGFVWWCSCHKFGPCLWPLCSNHRLTEGGCFEKFKSCFVSFPGRVWYACRMRKELFLWKRSVDMMGIEFWMSFIQWAQRYPSRKWLGWILGNTPSSPSPDLREYTFCLNQIWFFQWLSHSYLWVPLFTASFFKSMLQFPVGQVHFCCVVRNVLTPAWYPLFCPLFPEARYVCVRSGLLLLALPILFQRYLRCRPCTRSPFWAVTRSMQSPGIVA